MEAAAVRQPRRSRAAATPHVSRHLPRSAWAGDGGAGGLLLESGLASAA